MFQDARFRGFGIYGDGKDELFTAPLSQMTHQKASIVNNYT